MQRMYVAEHVVDQFGLVVERLAAGDLERARAAVVGIDLDAIERVRRERRDAAALGVRVLVSVRTDGANRRSITQKVLNSVFERDNWTCRICGTRTIDLRVLKAVSALLPDSFRYHPHWKPGESHPIYWTHSASLEHVVPFKRNGADDESNFVTTCYSCNDTRKELMLEEVGWELLPPASTNWRGFAELIGALSSQLTE